MTTCTNCGGHISFDYVRVFADESGRVAGCPSCEASPAAFG